MIKKWPLLLNKGLQSEASGWEWMIWGDSMGWSKVKGWGNIVGKDMLSDKRASKLLEWREVVQVEGALQSLNWGGNFFLFILVSTGKLSMKWLSCMWTLWWNHCLSHGQSAEYNIYICRNKMKQIARVQEWQVTWLACWAVWQVL